MERAIVTCLEGNQCFEERPILKAELFGISLLTTRIKALGFFRIPFLVIAGPHKLNLVHGWPALPNSVCLLYNSMVS